MSIEGNYESDSDDEAPKATPISPGLDPIMEESDEEMMTSSEPNVRQRKKKNKKKKKTTKAGVVPMMPVFVMNPYMNVEPGQMPTFRSGKSGQVPYQLAFSPMQVEGTSRHRSKKKKQVKNSKGHTVSFNSEVGVSPDPSTTSLPQLGKMLTFSSLRVKKEKKKDVVVLAGGSYTGHASMDISTVTKNSGVVKKGIMKKSPSDSSTS